MSIHDDDAWLAGSEALHSALASIPGVSVIVVDHDIRIRAIYGNALQRHGYVHERMIGRLSADVMRDATWRRLRPLYAQALAGKTVTICQSSEDDTAVYESTFSPVRRDGRVVAATMTSRDITAQTTAEQKLAEASGRLQAILDHSPMAIYLRDLQQRWVVANAETCGIMGKTSEELVGHLMSESFPPDVFEKLDANDREVIQSGEQASFDELVADARTGEVRHVWSIKFPVRDAEGHVTGLGGVSLDVTDRERTLRELVAARSLFEAAFASAPVGMLISRISDENSTEVIECNRAFAHMLGVEPAEIVGNVGPVIVPPDDLPLRQRLLDDLLAGRPTSAEIRFTHRDGHDVCALTAPSMTLGPDGERLIVLQAVDITERKALEHRLQYLADRDALTGLFTRRRFEEELAREVGRAHRHRRPGALLLLDLDGFKHVNDTFGHASGDEILIRVAAALRRALRHGDVLARLGGDEFALLLPDTDVGAARIVAEKLVDTVREGGRIENGGRGAEVTVSIGVTCVSGERGLGAAQLMVEADMAMYQAKAAGKNGVSLYGRGDAAAAA